MSPAATFSRVDFPDPLGPMTRVVLPAGIRRFIPLKTASVPEYRATSSRVIAAVIGSTPRL
jgi:hypothetical protein